MCTAPSAGVGDLGAGEDGVQLAGQVEVVEVPGRTGEQRGVLGAQHPSPEDRARHARQPIPGRRVGRARRDRTRSPTRRQRPNGAAATAATASAGPSSVDLGDVLAAVDVEHALADRAADRDDRRRPCAAGSASRPSGVEHDADLGLAGEHPARRGGRIAGQGVLELGVSGARRPAGLGPADVLVVDEELDACWRAVSIGSRCIGFHAGGPLRTRSTSSVHGRSVSADADLLAVAGEERG